MNVSIIIATYGEEHWADLALQRAYPSAQAQDDHEVIVGHDPDGTIAGVRNALAANAEGDWLCFLDADDELAPGYLGAMRRAAERTGPRSPRLLTPAVQKVRGGMWRGPAAFAPEENLLHRNWLPIGTLLEHTLFEYVGGFEEYPHGFEDWSLWFKCAHVGAQVVRVPKAVYVQHVNPMSVRRQAWKDWTWQVETHDRVQGELEAWARK